jgi:UDP-GlcNAc:undecaprenyl-phosphate GlcNAc-1-phosphate transferase
VSPANLSLLLVAALSFVVATLLTPLVARIAVGRGWLDHPDGHRKTHASPIPTVGGIAVVVAFVVTLALLPSLAASVGEEATILSLWAPLALASLAVSAVGIADDLRGVKPLAKLAVQTAAAVFLFYSGFRVEGISNPLGGSIDLGILALPVTVLWLVGMSNAFNLIDGLDGLAAGLAFVSTAGLLATAALSARHETALVAAALAGALLGFLPYNFNPARVFLGDCGALPVGFILAAIAVQSSIKTSAAIAVAVPLLALALPILDVGLSVVRRVVRRRPVFAADRDHIHHRLVEMGLTPRRAVVTLYGVAVLFTALALAVAAGPRQVTWAAAAVVVLLVWAGVRALGYWEVTEFQRSFLTRLTAGLRASGDAALQGLELDLARTDDPEWAWSRLCETAWALGFRELRVVPRPDVAPGLSARAATAPHHAASGDRRLGEAEWAFAVETGGRVAADVVARRVLDRADFDPGRFVAAVQRVASLRAPRPAVPEAVGSTLAAAPELEVPEPR